jgi:serine/threonine protein kinase
VEKRSDDRGSDSDRCPYCGELLDSRGSSSQTDEGDGAGWAQPDGTSQTPTEIRETIDWVKTWAQGSLGSLGRFQIRERMGDGGFGSVFRAYDPRLDRDVAVKVLKQANPSERMMERFFREARAVARLDHPNIVGVYDAGFDEGRCWVAYQLVSGRPLWWYREHHPMDAVTYARIVRALADALDHSHYLGVVHRDLKPANVIIDDRGQPRLIDFGLARRSDLESDLTRDGAILGTPAYMSPEQALGRSRQVDERTDVYSLGVIFYELLTGHHPDEPSTTSSDPPLLATPAARLARAAQRAPSMNPSIPPALRQICNKAMATDPQPRYPTARALADELDSYLLRQEHRNDRLRLAVAGAAMGVALAAILLLSFNFLAAPRVTHAERQNGLASVTTDPSASGPSVKDQVAAMSGQPETSNDLLKVAHSSDADVQLIGNSNTGSYHRSTCSQIQQMVDIHRVILAGPDDAASKKFRPCQRCKPPVVAP